jgi:maltose alpha-D-glucosyltransferase/alpha-amylase
VLKRIRAALDARHPGRVLLAEANQWPADVRPYFGDGDECHMAFHFPLMPRMFMGLRLEERHPIVEIMNQTPEIPEACQWAIFLRNHDELTLEMVTDEERDYMYAQYATDPQMRLNLGIRRRLAPLMENSRRRIELMTSLLFSMPGTPVIYYGDEIGMGDNVYLGDRNGVRTPMQWSSDRNGGFSRADPGRLFLPAIMDPVHGYDAINVEAQERSPFSLLNWMKRMIAQRKQHPVFGRGSIEFISTSNRKVLTYVRRHEGEIVLCVANLARTVQPVEIMLPQFAGLTPVEMLGQTEFPRIGELPYFLTLAPYGFYWFRLQEAHTPMTARTAAPADEPAVSLPALFAGVVWDSLLDGSMRLIVERHALVPFLQRQRWFQGKARSLAAARFVDWLTLRRGPHPGFLTIVEAEYRDGSREEYLLPLAMTGGAEAERVEREHSGSLVARITGARKGVLYDGVFDDATCSLLLSAMQDGRTLASRAGSVGAVSSGLAPERAPADALAPISRSAPDQSNTSVLFGRRLIMKVFRRLEAGPNPDVEIGRYLAGRGFTRVPRLLGAIESSRPGREPASLVMLQEFVRNEGNAWQVTIEELGRYFERRAGRPLPAISPAEIEQALSSPAAEISQDVRAAIGTYLNTAEVLGRRTGELHAELAAAGPGDEAFAPEPMSPDDLAQLAASMRRHAAGQLDLLERSLPRLDPRKQALATAVLQRREDILRSLDEVAELEHPPIRIRIHGDYHLGQVLVSEGDITILDFEGEPARPLAERRAKSLPLRDVAGMLRSFSYAALTALGAATQHRPEDYERLEPWAAFWETWVSAVFLRAYFAAVGPTGLLPSIREDVDLLLQTFTLDKAVYELAYELNNRPDWVHIPLAGLLRLRTRLHA